MRLNISRRSTLSGNMNLNGFVYRSLKKHSGLPVLWTLGFLQDRLHTGSFWYLPEVDLYETDDDPETKNEIDILCVLDGTICAVEVKLSASAFLNKPKALDKFVKMIGLLRPDVALLAFERYCAEGGDAQAPKTNLAGAAKAISEQIGPGPSWRFLSRGTWKASVSFRRILDGMVPASANTAETTLRRR